MVVNCVFCGKKKENNNLSFHKFPLKNPTLLEQWLQNMKLGSQFQPTESMKLCSDHFSKDLLKRVNSEEVLLPGSVPTIFENYKSACVYCHAKKSDEKKRSFHVFPMEKPILLEKWITAMNSQNFTPNKQSLLCSDHFVESCYRANKSDHGRRLKPNAVPSLFEPLPAMEQSFINNNSIDSITSVMGDTQSLPEMESRKPTLVTTANLTVSPCGAPSVKRRLFDVTDDHNYDVSPRKAERQLKQQVLKMKELQNVLRIRRQHVVRLKKKVVTLKDIVQELRRTRAVPERALDNLDSIAEDDISQFLQRYFKNQKKVGPANSSCAKIL